MSKCSLCGKMKEKCTKYLHYSDDSLYGFAIVENFCNECEESYFIQSKIREGLMRKIKQT